MCPAADSSDAGVAAARVGIERHDVVEHVQRPLVGLGVRHRLGRVRSSNTGSVSPLAAVSVAAEQPAEGPAGGDLGFASAASSALPTINLGASGPDTGR